VWIAKHERRCLEERTGNIQLGWWRERAQSIKSFLELCFTLFLDALLILFVWHLKQWVTNLIGVDPSTLKDETIRTILNISNPAIAITIAVYVLVDIFRHVLKALTEIRSGYLKFNQHKRRKKRRR